MKKVNTNEYTKINGGNSNAQCLKQIGKSGAEAAVGGAAGGSAIPGVGTLGGALIGGTYGVLAGSMDCAADRNL